MAYCISYGHAGLHAIKGIAEMFVIYTSNWSVIQICLSRKTHLTIVHTNKES